MKETNIKVIWPNNKETFVSEGDDWFSSAEKAGLEIPTGCLTGSCGACEIDVNGETVRACISNIKNNKGGTIAGTYIHGIFENDSWRAQYINLIGKNKNLPILNKKSISYKEKRETIINNLANEFHKHLNLKSFLS